MRKISYNPKINSAWAYIDFLDKSDSKIEIDAYVNANVFADKMTKNAPKLFKDILWKYHFNSYLKKNRY